MNKTYDLRSDTLTRPTEEMRKAMYDAEVGDDVYLEDPTVNLLQERAAELTGKQDSLFLPSGSMGNLIPIFLNCGRGNEIIAHEKSHIFHYELTSLASIAGVMPVAVPGDRGIFTPENVEPLIRPDIYYMARSRMIEIENTHNLAGGTCWSVEEMATIRYFARKHKLSVHLDGARLMNATVALDVPPVEFCKFADTVTFCLSKGLGAPVGSMLCGSREFIAEARRVRKLLGGGMRQIGILAAAGLYALEHNIDRLADDHRHAAGLADVLSNRPWATIDPKRVETNIIYFDTVDVTAEKMAKTLERHGIRSTITGSHTIRWATCLEIDQEDCERICSIVGDV
jgi:threonine aldolase